MMEFDFRMKMSRKSLMKHANDIAKVIVTKVGNYSIALKFALKYCWKQVAKNRDKKRFTKASVRSAAYQLTHRPYNPKFASVAGVYAFFWNEKVAAGDISQQEYQAVRSNCYSEVVMRETAKAVNMKFMTDFGNVFMWVPKAMLAKY